MKNGKEIFKTYFNDDVLIDKLDEFYKIHQDAKINLTAIKDYNDFYIKHYLDSLYIFKTKNLEFKTLMDIGSGGGFPGIPIALLYPDKEVYLVESISKKAHFLDESINKLDIKNVKVINERCEKISFLDKIDVITARGVATITKILKWVKNVSRETKYFIFYKGENFLEEIEKAKKVIDKFNLETEYVRVEKPFKRSYVILYRNHLS
ncbi:16S rRNA (guanine(527)-N(7))-methyltransferase RsmG [Deferribacter thermophilus]|uniref:16S rRNA (guanine(527)-N(7))-methyltransferase RsmG n=1 Tax=Deferribacter thermophilus TaxID=53573 RepID=UPI003C1B43A8